MTYGQLPQPRPNRQIPDANSSCGYATILARQPFLRCPECGGRWSANPGDYWDRDKGKEITCGECETPLVLVDEVSTLLPVEV